MPGRSTRTRLPHFLAVIYGLAIVYASLQPFANWIAPPPGTPFFLFGPWPPRASRFDVLVNVLAYVPFGFFVALVPRRYLPGARLAVAAAAGAALSFPLETAQMFTPLRDASVADFLANTAGAALGGLAALAFARAPRAWYGVSSLRERLFLPGTVGDLGLALVAVWLAGQLNPGIPLFASMFEAAPRLGTPGAPPDLAALLVEGAHSAFQLLGVGLFVALLLRERSRSVATWMLACPSAISVRGRSSV